MDPKDFDLAELAASAGVTTRTIRYYVQQGLLPSPGTRGPGTKYDPALLDRLRLIKLLQRAHWPLAVIREHLEGLDDDAVRRELAQPPVSAHAGVSAGVSDSALKYVHDLIARERAPSPAAPVARAVLAAPMPAAQAPPDATPAPSMVARSTWERVPITRDIEVHVRRPLTREHNKLLDQLLALAHKLFTRED